MKSGAMVSFGFEKRYICSLKMGSISTLSCTSNSDGVNLSLKNTVEDLISSLLLQKIQICSP